MALFKELCHDEVNPISILMVTHDPDLASNADRMLLLNDGRTEASDIRSAWGLDEDVEAESASGDAEPVVEATDGGEEE
jgi:ABC-type lipoprotein export system ATPase subunit